MGSLAYSWPWGWGPELFTIGGTFIRSNDNVENYDLAPRVPTYFLSLLIHFICSFRAIFLDCGRERLGLK